MVVSERKRKGDEKRYHDFLRNKSIESDINRCDDRNSNKKYYSVCRKSRTLVTEWLRAKIQGRVVLDYCCGNGDMAIWMVENSAARVHAIDISNISINNGKKEAERKGFEVFFHAMDAESLAFANNSFDIVYESGVLHHLDIERAYSEIARVLGPDGEMICVEALKYNPFIQCYRRGTPHLRTEWEVMHLFGKSDIARANDWFQEIEVLGWFHLSSIMGVVFRELRSFEKILSFLERIDEVLLRIPGMRWWAWQLVFVLRKPYKRLDITG